MRRLVLAIILVTMLVFAGGCMAGPTTSRVWHNGRWLYVRETSGGMWGHKYATDAVTDQIIQIDESAKIEHVDAAEFRAAVAKEKAAQHK